MMDKAELKAALKKAEGKPMSCVVGLDGDGQAVILLDRHKGPRKLLAEVKARGRAENLGLDPASLRRGRVSVRDGEAAYVLNKAPPPPVRQAMKAPMRAAGHPRFTLNADPAIEAEPDEDGEGRDGEGTAGGAAAAPEETMGTLAPSEPSGAPGAAAPGATLPGVAALEGRLLPLVKRVSEAVKSGWPGADRLRLAAVAAHGALRSGDLAAAGQGADKLERLLSDPAAAAATQSGRKVPAASVPKPPAPAVGGSGGTYDATGNTEQAFEDLAKDPAHNGKVTPGAIQERRVALELERRGEIPPPVRRDPSGAADFLDGKGTKWDVKGFNSNFPPKQGGFSVAVDAGKVDKSLALGENVMLDTTKMKPPDIAALKAEGAARNWGDKVKWWP